MLLLRLRGIAGDGITLAAESSSSTIPLSVDGCWNKDARQIARHHRDSNFPFIRPSLVPFLLVLSSPRPEDGGRGSRARQTRKYRRWYCKVAGQTMTRRGRKSKVNPTDRHAARVKMPSLSVRDIYQDELQAARRKEWEVKPEDAGPYLRYLQTISSKWPHLRLLTDFMEVGTDPLRWRNFYGNDVKNTYTYPDDAEARKDPQSNRVERTHVTQLKYLSEGGVEVVGEYSKPRELGAALNKLDEEERGGGSAEANDEFRLFVVEDLSREVIEKFGYHFDIDPDFFRAHILDHAWFNIRDPFWNPPSLQLDLMRNSWYQIRFCRARYFSSHGLFDQAQEAANKFNVGRKLYEDENKAYWDVGPLPKPGKALLAPVLESLRPIKNLFTILSKPIRKVKAADIEKILCGLSMPVVEGEEDVDAKSQVPVEEVINGKVGLIRTRATFWERKCENNRCGVGVLLLDPTIKEGFQLWRGHRNWRSVPPVKALDQWDENEPRTEASFFDDFVYWAQNPVISNKSPVISNKSPEAPASHVPAIALLRLVCAEWLTLDQEMISEAKFTVSHTYSSKGEAPSAMDKYKDELGLVLEQMEEYEKRIDRLTTVVTSAISIMDSRRAERLTRLATLFVPLSLVGTLFSMSEDIAQIGITFGYWAAASLFLLLALLLWNRLTQSHTGGGKPAF
ncbi:hypothetical protein GQX73_g8289 [Xylaria multiplex]|uniref:Uncharacterized protein n=1 Tax=Xylaria multiplex TaxID=323545 RepID=A0A7C8IJN7_9PEZI|nr:hypothetical protein GQX73_g8289 [Xylaria multiplex]